MTDQNSKPTYPIVCIGASAGGLAALQRFLAVLPADFGFALVFIQHLSAKHKSLLQELLSARRPSLVIQQIADGLKIEPGRLYLAPPGREVRLQNHLFQTTVHPEGLLHLPIDEFLSSLAADAAERSVAVIFSGAGTDGARGCQAIRSAGGTVLVQDPQTAEFDSMPLSAIATGQADAVLSPEEIASELLKHQGVHAAVDRNEPITPDEYEEFFQLLQKKTGSRFHHYKKSVVSRRIKRRMYLQGLSAVKEYLDLISKSDPEAALLASDLMIGVTSFFRDRVAWKALNLEAVRKIAAENSGIPVRVWTPASATGEEAYSIAMMLQHELALAGKKRDIYVFATDVNDRALERAREGKYPASISADVPKEYIQKYFTSADDGNCLVINKDVRERVVFARQDLLSDPPFSKLDLIICRNFMIYLEPEAQEKAIRLFHYALNNGGYLFLGNAETVGRKSGLFKSIGHKQCRVYQKLETKPASKLPLSVPYERERRTPAKQAQAAEQGRSIVEIIQEKLLEEYGPACVAIDQNYDIIYHNGPTNRYLTQPRGVPTQNLLELVPENLRSRIRGALYRSGREGRPVVVRTSVAGDDSRKRQVSLRITKATDSLSVVVFQEQRTPARKEAAEQVDAAVIEETAIHQLESELAATRADLQSNIEQLRSMNEEFQSSNEELQAANEELETSREELQSLNEELITVNSQLQGKIEEQDVTNNDLNNFLASTNIPTIFLDTHFRVKRFTPAMLKLIKLLPSDVGRPIVDMSQENLGPDLTSDAQAVLDSLVSMRKELEVDGVWYIRATQPYRTSDSRIEGVVVTYTDITERKRDEEIKGRLAALVESADDAIISKDLSGVIQSWNVGAEKIFGYTASEAVGRNISFLVPPGHVDEVPEILRRISAGEHIEHFESLRMRKDGEVIPVSLTYSAIKDASGKVIGVSKISHDITERKKAEEALRQGEEQFRALADSIPNLAWWANGDGYITWYNQRWYEYTGTTPEQMEGWGWQSVHDPEALPKVLERWKASISTGEPFEMEFPLRGADGVFRTFLTRVMPLKDPAGRVVRWFGTNTDVSALKRVEDALRVSEERYRNLFNTMDEGFCIIQMIFDAEGRPVDYRFLEINAAFEKQTGLHDAQGKLMRELAPAHEAHWFEIYGKIALTGEPLRFVNEARALNRWYDVYAYRVGRPEDRHVAILFSDISEHKRAEEETQRLLHAVQEEKDRLSALINSINDEIWFADSEKKFTLANPSALQAFAIDTGEIDVEKFAASLEVYRPDGSSRPVEEAPPLRALQGEVITNQEEIVRTPGTGELRHRQVSSAPVRDAGGNIIGSVSVVHDITERKKAEEALKLSEERLRMAHQIARIGSFEWDLVKQMTVWSPELEALYGLQPGTIGGRYEEFASRVHPDDLPETEKRIREALDIGTFEAEWRVLWPDGTIHWMAARGQVFKDDTGKPLRMIGINLDITERKQAEEQLNRLLAEVQRHVAELDAVFKVLPYLVSVHDEDGKYLRVNQAVIDLFGFDPTAAPREEIARRIKAHFPDGRPLTPENMPSSRALRGETIKDVEYVITNERGEEHVLLFNAIPLRLNGQTYGAVFSQLDITERNRAEEALRLSEEKFSLAFANNPAAIALTRLDNGIFMDVNDTWVRLNGYSRDEVIGRSAKEFPIWPAAEDRARFVRELLGKGIVQGWEQEFRNKSGGFFVTQLSAQVLVVRGEKLILSTFVDITARKQAEEALKGSEQRYHSLFENMIEGFAYCKMLYDDNGQAVDFMYLEVNSAFTRLTGLTDVVGKKVTEVIPGIRETDPELFRIYGRVATTCQSERMEFYVEALKMWFSLAVYCPQKEYFVAVFDVITERKKSEAELLKLSEDMAARNMELEALNKELEAFNYSISHDLRAPLRSMSGFSGILTEQYAEKLDDQGKDYLARIQNGSEKMTRLIDDMMRLSKISRQEIVRIDIDLSRLVETAIHAMRELYPGRTVEVVVQKGVRAFVDPNLMKAVMTNLLDNAWKFTSKTDKARIEFGIMKSRVSSLESQVSSSEPETRNSKPETNSAITNSPHSELPTPDSELVYFVKDNGAGFEMTYANKMFWPFHRLHAEKEFAGTGIGLAIVERIIRRHDGKVWAEGEPGKGAVVYFTLGCK